MINPSTIGRTAAMGRAWPALLSLFVGCALPLDDQNLEQDSSDSAEVASSEQPLIGGTVTNARPEVGRLNGSFYGCTVTMITPRYFITAAHCIAYMARFAGPGVTVGLTTVTRGTPVTVQHPVAQIFSLGGDPNAFVAAGCPQSMAAACANGVGLWDVAVGQLVNPVTPNGWTPAQISDLPAQTGVTSVTLMGTGCTNRANINQGQGTKRFVQGTFGNTNNSCQGDSGGPVFIGNLADNGRIMAIMSGQNGVSDIYADVSYHKTRIESLIRSLEFLGLESGMDRPGFDIGGALIVPDIFQCAMECAKLSNCLLFTYDTVTRQCWRKSAVANQVFGNMNKFTSLRVPTEPGDRFGSDITGSPINNVQTPYDCQIACAGNPQCVAFTHLNATKQCYIKHTVPPLDLNNPCGASGNCRTGIKTWSELGFSRLAFSGVSVFETTTQSTPLKCKDRCSLNLNCQAWTWTQTSSSCALQNRAPQPVVASALQGPATQSGVRGGFEHNTNRNGSDVAEIVFTEPDPQRCQVACAADSRCKAWTLTTMASNNRIRCYLKSAVGSPTPLPGAVSGVKGLDFFTPR